MDYSIEAYLRLLSTDELIMILKDCISEKPKYDASIISNIYEILKERNQELK